MNPVNIYDAKARLSELVQRAAAGEEIIVARNGKPAARWVALAARPERRAGGWEGRVWVAPDVEGADATVAGLMLGGDSPERGSCSTATYSLGGKLRTRACRR